MRTFIEYITEKKNDLWIGRLKTIVDPYFFWSLLQGGIQVALAGTGADNAVLGLRLRSAAGLPSLPTRWRAVAALGTTFLVVADLVGVPERLPIPAALRGIAATFTFGRALERTPAAAGVVRSRVLLGPCSMAIVVMHVLVLGFVRTLLLRLLGIDDLVALPSSAGVGRRGTTAIAGSGGR